MRFRGLLTIGVLAGALVAAVPAEAAVLTTHPKCTDVAAKTSIFHAGGLPLVDWRENLEFDGEGTLWVSHTVNNNVEGYRPDGSLRTTVDNVQGPGGIRRGPGGRMYVNFRGAPLPPGGGGIASFDPAAAKPVAKPVVTGLSGPNGLDIDDDGNFYIGSEFEPSVIKIRPDGTRDEAWTAAADVVGSNGVSIEGQTLYTPVTTSLESLVVRVPLADPGAHSTVPSSARCRRCPRAWTTWRRSAARSTSWRS